MLADSLATRFRSYEKTRKKIERLASTGQISRRDVEHTYEGLFLSVYAYFENFIDELFFGLLIDGMGCISSRRDIQPRFKVRSHPIARDLVLGTSRKYVDWLPYHRTIELAKIYFRGGRPFTELTDNQKLTLNKGYIIRNAIAHKSRFSLNKFITVVIGNTPLLPIERNPIGYLRGSFRIAPYQTRYENFTSELLLIARVLSQ
jgi:hypothetical protein